MSINKTNPYDLEPHIAEIYDSLEKQVHDVNFIIGLLEKYECKNILEAFCGTGRILLPIAEAGLEITGIDGAEVMLNHLQHKIKDKPISIRDRIKIIKADLTEYTWPKGYDAVILGGNCFFELASLEEQEIIFNKAYHSIKRGGYIFIDNDNIENELPDSWCNINVEGRSFPSGICEDGTELKAFTKPTYVDKKNKIWKAQRRLEVYKENRKINEYFWETEKHPIGYIEIMEMANNLNLKIIDVWEGTEKIKSYTPGAKRATFWLQKK